MKTLARLILRVLGWRLDGSYPDIPKSVMIIAPHTSMWDFVIGKLAFWAHGIKGRFMIKEDMFFFPLGSLLKALGGHPVDRSGSSKTIFAVCDDIRKADRFILIITPEGTRKRVNAWKKGFYLIAQHAGVPVVLGCLDYAEKTAYIGPAIEVSGDYRKDMQTIEEYYRGRKGRHPERFNL